MAVSPETMAWLDWVSLTSVPLYRMDERQRPVGVASGCLVRLGPRRLLLSVSHATQEGSWVAEIGFDEAKDKTEVLYFGRQWTARHLDPAGPMSEDLDFSFIEVAEDFDPVMQERDKKGVIIRVRPRHEFETNLTDSPTADEVYAFTGRVHPARIDDLNFIADPTVYPGLKYDRTEGYYHVFKLPVAHPGHEAFQGCSGAPIVDRSRRVVALVCSGDVNSNSITGIGVQQISAAIHAHLGAAGA